MSATDIGAKVRSAALAAIDKQAFGEDFGFDASMVIAPAAGGAVVVYQLAISKPSPLLGSGPLVTVTQLHSPNPTAEQVEQAVTNALRGLRELSSKILADGDAAAAPHAR